LFARNFESPEQLIALCQAVRAVRKTPLLITADQEGGRVQRFKTGFVRLPSMQTFGLHYRDAPNETLQVVQSCGWIMAAELLAAGIDLSFAPVLDLNKAVNTAIGDRSFAADAETTSLLATALMQGMKAAGMVSTGKHFPGHGSVQIDSHYGLPIDLRDYSSIYQDDLKPFIALIQAGVTALMPAHIVFPAIDDKPVVFSSIWLNEILRKQLHFTGVIFSDDLNMKGADVIGGYSERAMAALEAGCDIALICNNRPAAIEILDQLPQKYFLPTEKFNSLRGKFSQSWQTLHTSSLWQKHFHLFNSMQETS
jgi:beta-N-acetylhexosaminidase